ncbi:MAG: hypothetical protein ABW019_04485 [Chitinophagaceae bacterium]
MQPTVQLTLTRDLFILCCLFQCTPEEVLQFYMQQVGRVRPGNGEDEATRLAIAFLISCGAK